MRTFDRAMYALFLLVLLAEVGRAQSLVPAELMPAEVDPSGGLILGIAAQVRVPLGVDAVALRRADVGTQRSLASSAPASSVDLFAEYRAVSRKYRAASASPTRGNRGIFDRFDFAPAQAASQIVEAPITTPHLLAFRSGSPRVAVVEHTGSPAP